MRDRIDWDGLKPLPRRRIKDGATRDDLAARRHNMQKAKHKGRCHITNQKRRQIAKSERDDAAKRNAIKNGKFRAVKDRIRSYWNGDIDEHP